MKEVNLKDMTEADWEKYRRMKKIAESRNLNNILLISVFLVYFGLSICLMLLLASSPSSIIHNNLPYANSTIFNSSQLSFIYNKTLSNAAKSSMLVSALQNRTVNAKVLAFVLETSLSAFVLASLVLVIIILIFYFVFVEIVESPSTIRSKSGLQEVLKYYQKARNRLLAHNYTEADVQWYFAVRAKIISLKTNPYELEEVISEIKEVK